MKAARLDRRVKKEAKLLIKQARKIAKRPRDAGGPTRAKAEQLEDAVGRVDAGLEKKDLAAVRSHLPRLDAIVDDLSAGHGKSTFREYVESIGVAIAIALVLRAFVVEAFKIPSSSMIPTMEIGDHIFVNKFIYGVRIPWTRTKLFEVRPPHRGEVIVFMNPCIPDKDYIKRIIGVAGDTIEVRCHELYVNGQHVDQKLTQGEGCTYWDLIDEDRGTWQEKRCNRYHENLFGTEHDTLYADNRKSPSKLRDHDFPRLAAGGGDQLDMMPSCNLMPDATEHPADAGKIIVTANSGMAKAECDQQVKYEVPKGYVFCMSDNRDNSNDSRTWGPVPVENIKGKSLFIWWSDGEPEGVRVNRLFHLVR